MAVKTVLKRIIKHLPIVKNVVVDMKRWRHRNDAQVENNSPNLLIIKDFIGEGNVVNIGKENIGTLRIRIRGNNNKIEIGSNCSFGPDCSLWIEGSHSLITIGSNTTMTRRVQINCQEDNRKIVLGEDCMLANTIVIRTSDSHPIYDKETGERINPAKDVEIGNHVWIAPNSKVMKGAKIGDGAIVGSDTTVSKPVEPNTMVVGRPQKVVKTGIEWSREKLF
ncbi:MAG: acyltransferase [Muribaculaceae bacterium]|nr:acyltransferase [Muribaculaceae bacterium]